MTHTLTLNTGYKMPQVGLGTWRLAKDQAATAVRSALVDSNYLHVDCAMIYDNEKEIGESFKTIFAEGKIKREDIFITSKLWNTQHHPDNVEKACRQTLADLQLDYLDLYLVHWGMAFQPGTKHEPVGEDGIVATEPVPIQQTWQAMESLVEKGLVKSIGVANFTVILLNDLLSYAKIKPAINQVEIHPYNSQERLVKYCQRLGITVTAYSPLGSSGPETDKPVNNPTILALAENYHKTPAQILLRWLTQRQIIAIPKSSKAERIAENTALWDFELSTADMEQINGLNRNFRYVDPIAWWGIPYFQ